MSSLVSKNFQLVLLPLPSPDIRFASYYQRAANCWEEVWLKLFDEYKVEHPLFLDNLLRQDEAACIFTPKGCVGLILFRTIDFAVLDYRRDSYFKEWSEQDIGELLKHGSRAFLATFLTVHPDFRAFSKEFKFKEVFLDIMIKRFKEGQADVISGITRRDRGIHDESYKLGAHLIHENVDYMDGRFQVDLVGFYRHRAVESPTPSVRQISDLLWAKRIDVGVERARRLNAA